MFGTVARTCREETRTEEVKLKSKLEVIGGSIDVNIKP